LWNRDEYTSGSVGAGLVIEPPAYITIEAYSKDISIVNGKIINLPHQKLAKKLLNVEKNIRVTCTTAATLGKGYGLSAALSIAYSIGYYYAKYREVKLDTIFRMAHLIEVKLLTGLGDVIAEVEGGELEIREKPGAPGIGKLIKVKVGKRPVIVIELERKMDTTTMLRSMFAKIKTGAKLLEKLTEEKDLKTFLDVAYNFSKHVGFLDCSIEDKLRKIKNMIMGYFCKKQVLVIVPEEEFLEDVYEYVCKVFSFPCKVFYTRYEGTIVKIEKC